MTTNSPTAGLSRRVLSAYVAIWSVLAVGAIGYLTAAAAFPEQLSAVKLSAAEEAEVQGLKELAQNLKIELDGVRNELASVRRQRAEAEERAGGLASRLAALEAAQTRPTETAAAAEPRTAPPVPRIINAPEPPAAAAPIETGSIVASLKPGDRPVAEKQATAETPAAVPARKEPLQRTAGTPPPPKKADGGFGTTEVKPKQATVGLQLGASSSLDMARLNWSILADQNQELRSLQPRVSKSDARGAADPYNLIAGPVGTREEAQRLCGALEQRGVSCKVGSFGGDAL